MVVMSMARFLNATCQDVSLETSQTQGNAQLETNIFAFRSCADGWVLKKETKISQPLHVICKIPPISSSPKKCSTKRRSLSSTRLSVSCYFAENFNAPLLLKVTTKRRIINRARINWWQSIINLVINFPRVFVWKPCEATQDVSRAYTRLYFVQLLHGFSGLLVPFEHSLFICAC